MKRGKGNTTVMLALTALIVLVVALFAYGEILTAVTDGVCPSAQPYYLTDGSAGKLCCADNEVAATCTGAANFTGVPSLFGDTPYLFINNVVPVFGIIGVFATLLVLLSALRKKK